MFCPQCGRESAADARFCSACGASAVSTPPSGPRMVRIVRPRSPRMVAGVCSGVAIYYGWDVALVRILYVVFVCLTSGLGALAYVAAWIVMPDAQYALPAVSRSAGSTQGTAV